MSSDAVWLKPRGGNPRTGLPWLLYAVVVLLSAVAIGLVIVNRAIAYETNEGIVADLLNYAGGIVVGLVGALIAARRRDNPIGWLMLAAGVFLAVPGVTTGYAIFALILHPGALPGGPLAAWLAQWIWIPPFFILPLVVLFYPTGKLLSARWRLVAWAAAVNAAVMAVLLALDKNLPIGGNPDAPLIAPPNPFGLLDGQSIWPIVTGGFILSSGLILLALGSVVIRFIRSKGQERQQIKWFLYALALFTLFQAPSPFVHGEPGAWLQLLDNAASLLVPAAIGIAMLRYHLYDVDLLINRTLVYIPLTAMLAGIFAASIAVSQKLFLLATGSNSDAATVLTTLIVVAAFEPLKTGLQHFVDRRFKEAPDPAARVRAFDRQVQSFIQVADAGEITRRLLDETQAAFDASGGALFRGTDGARELIRTVGEWDGQANVSVPLEIPETHARIGELALGPRKNGSDYTPQDREILKSTARDVARAVLLAGGIPSHSRPDRSGAE